MINENSDKMKTLLKIYLLTGILMSIANLATAQKPITWQRLYGDSNHDVGYSTEITMDGGFIFSGLSGTGMFCRVVKVNAFGEIIWNKFFSGNVYEDIAQTPDSCFVLAGYATGISGIGTDGYIIKINQEGDLLWWKKFGGPSYDYFHDILITNNDELMILGNYDSKIRNMYLVKTDLNGHEIWSRIYDSTGSGFNIDEIPEKGYLLSGSTKIYVDLNGNMKYSKKELGINGLYSINSNGFVFFDNKDTIGTDAIKFVKTDSLFNIVWTSWIYYQDRLLLGYDIIKDNSGYIIGGKNLSFQSDEDAYLLKIDTNGNKIWDRIIPPRFEFNEGIYSVKKCNDSGFIALGFSSTFFSSTESDFLAVKTDKNGNTVPISIENNYSFLNKDYKLFQNFPNPFNAITTIKYSLSKHALVIISVYDVTGKLIDVLKTEYKSSGDYYINYSSEKLSSGIYFYSMTIFEDQLFFDKKITKKFVVLK